MVEGVDDQFYNDRLDGRDPEDYPARIDQAAIDLLYGISVGESSESTAKFQFGGTVAKFDFPRATGGFYREGLETLSGSQSDLPTLIDDYDETDIGDLAFHLNELRYRLQKERQYGNSETELEVNRVIEAVMEKSITHSIRQADDSVSRQPLENPETVVEMMLQIFSDPSLTTYADQLLNIVDDRVGRENLLGVLDRPEMVTPLWNHQRQAIENWLAADEKGYVDMATATGKTVLGLATIAARYGRLHPIDEDKLNIEITTSDAENPRVLIVAGRDLLLEQWRSEFDEHLNIPRDRTRSSSDPNVINLEWGTIEFKTAQELLASETNARYDLAILDEAHRYSRGSQSGRGWRQVLEELVGGAEAVMAMSGSVDQGWLGDEIIENTLENNLERCIKFSVPEARKAGVIADFEWEVRYAGAHNDESQNKVAATTDQLSRAYDDKTHKFDITTVDSSLDDRIDGPFETLTDLRSFGQSKAGSELRKQSSEFDEIVTAAFSRRPQRWQLSPSPTVIADLVTEHAPEREAIVLVQSYSQATEIGDAIRDQIGEDLVLVPEADSEKQFDTVDEFNEGDYNVIVGPGDVLGTGVDMPEADVAINVSKGGVNASLIQRIGRVLRNPSGDKEATFYQVVTIPSDDGACLPGEDGRRLIRRASEFRALGTRLRELPGFATADDATMATLTRLEVSGADAMQADERSVDEIVDDEVAQDHLEALLEAINEHENGDQPILPVLWQREMFKREIKPVKSVVDQESDRDERSGDHTMSSELSEMSGCSDTDTDNQSDADEDVEPDEEVNSEKQSATVAESEPTTDDHPEANEATGVEPDELERPSDDTTGGDTDLSDAPDVNPVSQTSSITECGDDGTETDNSPEHRSDDEATSEDSTEDGPRPGSDETVETSRLTEDTAGQTDGTNSELSDTPVTNTDNKMGNDKNGPAANSDDKHADTSNERGIVARLVAALKAWL